MAFVNKSTQAEKLTLITSKIKAVKTLQRQPSNSTSGVLNTITEYLKINSPSKSVAVSKLLANHPEVKDEETLARCIDFHATKKCSCGLVAQKTLEQMAQALYDGQLELFKAQGKEQFAFSLECCTRYIYQLFVRYTLQGMGKETQLVSLYSKTMLLAYEQHKTKSRVWVRQADYDTDVNMAVDVEFMVGNTPILGVQVKGEMYAQLSSANDFVRRNIGKNEQYRLIHKADVFYAYYDKDGKWVNLGYLTDAIKNALAVRGL